MKFQKIVFGLIISALLVACSGQGSNYLGEWERVSANKLTMAPKSFAISKNGDNLMIEASKDNPPIPLIPQENGTYKVELWGSEQTMTYIEKDETLLFLDATFKRK